MVDVPGKMVTTPLENLFINDYMLRRPTQASRYATIFKTINGALYIGLAVVQVKQRFVLVLNHLNLLDDEGVIETLPVALQKEGKVAGQKKDNLMGKNTRSSVDMGLIVFGSLQNDTNNAIHKYKDGGRSKSQQCVNMPIIHSSEATSDKQSHVRQQG